MILKACQLSPAVRYFLIRNPFRQVANPVFLHLTFSEYDLEHHFILIESKTQHTYASNFPNEKQHFIVLTNLLSRLHVFWSIQNCTACDNGIIVDICFVFTLQREHPGSFYAL